MLFIPGGGFLPITDNFGATYTDAGLGTSATSGISHIKGTPVSLISGANVTEDIYGIGIIFIGGNGSNSIRRYLVDILVDSNGGSSWDVKIENLFVNNASLIQGGYNYFFPLYLKAGTSIGFQHQCNLNSTTLRCAIQLFGKPSKPELFPIGTIVESFGVAVGSTSGTAITPGTSVLGAYTTMGTSTRSLHWWQWGGIGYNESAFTANGILGDIGALLSGSTFKTCLSNCFQSYTGAEQGGKSAMGINLPYQSIPVNTVISVRASCSGTPETTPTTTAYGMG